MNIKNLYTPNFMQIKKTSFKSTQSNDNLQKEDVKFVAENINSQKKDMKLIVNNGAKGAIGGAIVGIFSQEYLHSSYGYTGIRKFIQNFKFSSVGFLAGGLLAAGATLLAIVNREEKK